MICTIRITIVWGFWDKNISSHFDEWSNSYYLMVKCQFLLDNSPTSKGLPVIFYDSIPTFTSWIPTNWFNHLSLKCFFRWFQWPFFFVESAVLVLQSIWVLVYRQPLGAHEPGGRSGPGQRKTIHVVRDGKSPTERWKSNIRGGAP